MDKKNAGAHLLFLSKTSVETFQDPIYGEFTTNYKTKITEWWCSAQKLDTFMLRAIRKDGNTGTTIRE